MIRPRAVGMRYPFVSPCGRVAARESVRYRRRRLVDASPPRVRPSSGATAPEHLVLTGETNERNERAAATVYERRDRFPRELADPK